LQCILPSPFVTSDFTWLCDLDEAKYLNIGHTYRNDKRAREFVAAIATDVRIKVSNILTTSIFASLISDGATEKFHLEAEVVYLRTATNKDNNKITELRTILQRES
jgi:hypothetical protein